MACCSLSRPASETKETRGVEQSPALGRSAGSRLLQHRGAAGGDVRPIDRGKTGLGGEREFLSEPVLAHVTGGFDKEHAGPTLHRARGFGEERRSRRHFMDDRKGQEKKISTPSHASSAIVDSGATRTSMRSSSPARSARRLSPAIIFG